MNGSNNQSPSNKTTNPETGLHPVKRLLVFQLKLAADALRDILLSPISLLATLVDLIYQKRGDNSYFALVMKYGRESEKRINLFEQHDPEESHRTIDSMMQQVEDILVQEFKSGEISAKAKKAIEKKLKNKTGVETNQL